MLMMSAGGNECFEFENGLWTEMMLNSFDIFLRHFGTDAEKIKELS